MAVLICRRQLLYLKQKSLWASRGRHYRNFASGASGSEYPGLKSWGVASERSLETPRTKVLGWWYGPYRAGNGSEHPRTSKGRRSSVETALVPYVTLVIIHFVLTEIFPELILERMISMMLLLVQNVSFNPFDTQWSNWECTISVLPIEIVHM